MPVSKRVEDHVRKILCTCTSNGCGNLENWTIDAAGSSRRERGAWLHSALYYRHRALDRVFQDFQLHRQNSSSLGCNIIMRTLSRTSSLSSHNIDIGVLDDETTHSRAVGDGDDSGQKGDEFEPEVCLLISIFFLVTKVNIDLISEAQLQPDVVMTGLLEEATDDLASISISIDQDILSFPHQRSLIFVSPPTISSSPIDSN